MNIEDYTLLHQIAANLLKINSQLGEFNKNYRAVHNIYGDETKIMKVPAGSGSIPADLSDEKKGFIQLDLWNEFSDDAIRLRNTKVADLVSIRVWNGLKAYYRDSFLNYSTLLVSDILKTDVQYMIRNFRSFGKVSGNQLQDLINRANKKRVIIDQL